MSGKGAGIAVALIGAGAVIIAALITSRAPICPDFVCGGADKATADERPGGKGDKQIIKVPGAKANVKVLPTEITCETEGVCKEKIEIESSGDGTLKVTYMEIKGDGKAYFSHDGSCEHKNMATGVTCAFDVNFTPPAEGGTAEATLVIHHNVGPHPSLVTLHGVGAVQPPTDTPTTGLPENG